MDDTLTVSAYIRADDDNNEAQKQSIVSGVSAGLQTGSIGLAQLVTSIDPSLFPDDRRKILALQYFADALTPLSTDRLSFQDVSLLVNYIVSRLTEEGHGIIPLCQALGTLNTQRRCPPSLAVEIPAKIYNAVEAGFSTLKVQSRFAVYRLFDEILTTRVERLKPTGAEFIDMIYDLCSNERDPRNLLRLLHTTEIILASFDAETLTTKQEVIYEFLMKYFPISFRSKPDDPSAIKAEDLQLALRKCFSVWSGFSEKFFPDLIPRLDDPNRINVKEDVLLTMKACVDKYEPVDVAKASTSLWNALKYEVFNHGDSSQAENATAVIRAIATNLSANLPFQLLSDSALAKYVKLVSGDCFEKITEKNPRFALASGKLLATVSTASPLAYHLVMKEALPKLIKAVKKNDATLDEHKSTLLIINSILESKFLIFKFQEHWDFPAMSVIDKLSQAADSQSEDALFQHKDELNDIFMGVASDNNLQDNELRSASIEGLSKLVRLPSFLDRESVETIIKFFTARVVAIGDIHDSLWQQLVDALKFSTASHSQIIMESTFPVLLSRLPDQYDPTHTSQYYAAITALAQISSEQLNLYETVWRRLISQLDHVVSANEGQDYAHIILAGLLQAVLYREAANMSAKTSDPLEKLAVQISAIVRKVIIVKWQRDEIQDLRVSGFRLAGSTSQVPDRISLDLIGRILLTLLRQLTAEQQTIALAYAFRDEDGPEPRIVKSDNVQDLDIGTASEAVKKIGARFIMWLDLKQERSLITIAKYIFGGLRREFDLSCLNNEVVWELTNRLIFDVEENDIYKEDWLQLFAIFVNKFEKQLYPSISASASSKPAHPSQQILLAGIRHANRLTAHSSISAKQRLQFVEVLFTYIMAANAARGGPAVSKIITYAFRSIAGPNKTTSLLIAKNTHRVLQLPEILSKDNFAVVQKLSANRAFCLALSVLTRTFSEANAAGGDAADDTKSKVLMALNGILPDVPSDTILGEIDTLLPLLLQSLSQDGNKQTTAAIKALSLAVVNSPRSVEAYDNSIIDRLIAVVNKRHTLHEHEIHAYSVETRLEALHCLEIVAKKFSQHVVVKYADRVIAQLRSKGKACEDERREVREAGVDCYTAWWNVVQTDAAEQED